MEPLLYTHKKTIDDIEYYVAKEEKRLAVLKKHLNLYRNEHILAMEDISNYLGNPINAFTLIKRLTKDLDFIEKSIMVGTNYVKNTTVNHVDVLYPTSEDLTGSVLALTRLQVTYQLDIGELSEGRLNGVNSSDCYEIGRTLYNEKDYRNSLRWMLESLRKLKSGDDLYNVTEVDILEYISYTHYLLDVDGAGQRRVADGTATRCGSHTGGGVRWRSRQRLTGCPHERDFSNLSSNKMSRDIQTALEWTKKILLLDPVHSIALQNVGHYQKILEERKELKTRGEGTVDEHSPSSNLLDEDTKRTYEALCRGDIDVPKEIQKKLKCSYLTENHPFLKLAPIKMEKMYDDPEVIVFHQVMSDEEIEHIKNQAKSKLTRAGVNNPATGQAIPAPYRISKTAWLRDDLSPVVARVSQRVSDFTGLTMSTAEDLQVANYGIGGHYVAHLDYYRDVDSIFLPPSGQRVATVLFYMSEVAQGGATVFTDLGLSVFPIKNAALFWMNVLPSGEGNERTRHAACPVLRGSKWDYVKNTTINHADVLYPTLEDLTGSVLALTRLQDTYRLHVGELSEGRLNGVISNDCYEIGRTLYNEKDYRNSLRWMIESLRKFNSGDDLYNVAEVDILEYISFTHYLLGDIQTALEWTKKILLLDPVHSNALNNVEYFQKALEEREELNRRGEVFTTDEHSSSSDLLDEDTKRTYEALCRGDIEVSNEIQKKMKCSYLTENHPFLKLAPIKMEKMYDDPEVIVFHQVMSDEEIEHIKNQAKSKLTRAGVNDPATGQAIAAPYRISKTAWLHDDLSPVVARVSQRVSDFTGLTMSTAEDLQVVNYGIGGHYVAHFDYYRASI
ncbi:unnamed protein product, partial [Iphiclides podalirius]